MSSAASFSLSSTLLPLTASRIFPPSAASAYSVGIVVSRALQCITVPLQCGGVVVNSVITVRWGCG